MEGRSQRKLRKLLEDHRHRRHLPISPAESGNGIPNRSGEAKSRGMNALILSREVVLFLPDFLIWIDEPI